MRLNYNRRRRLKLCATAIAVLLLYINIQLLSETNTSIPTGKVTGGLDMCVDEHMAIPSIDYLNATANSAFTYDLNITNEATYATVIYGDNTTLFSINTTTGLIQFTPRTDQVGSYSINVTARNGFCDNNDTSIVFTLNILPSNFAPSLNMGSQTLTEDVLYTYNVTLNATDPDGDILKFYDNTPLFVIGEDSGVIAFTPTNSQVGVYTVKIYVVDPESLLGYQSIQFTITNVNDAPVLATVGSQTAYVGEPWNHTLSATDVDSGESLTFTSNYSSLLSTSGAISTTAETATYFLSHSTNWTANGTYNINMTVSDTSGREDSEVISFTILYRNNPPNITKYYPTSLTPSVAKNSQQEFNITATDPDGTTPSIQWYVSGTPTGTTSINYTYTASAAGTFNITAIATDGEFNDSQSWMLSVTEAAAPVTEPVGGGGAGGGVGGPLCLELWTCTDWPPCPSNSMQIRDCGDIYKCGTIRHMPNLTQPCIFVEHPSCFDGVKNQNEILPDCGGTCDECPVCNDGIKNQGETDIDCGGPCPACKHKETPRFLGAYRDRIITPLGVFTRPNESWAFWALIPVMIFVMYKTVGMAIRRRIQAPAKRASKTDKMLDEIETLIQVTDMSMKKQDYKTAKSAYQKITSIYNKLPSQAKEQVYDKISKLSK